MKYLRAAFALLIARKSLDAEPKTKNARAAFCLCVFWAMGHTKYNIYPSSTYPEFILLGLFAYLQRRCDAINAQ